MRGLHPLAWWAWALGCAVAAAQLRNPWLLAIHIAAVSLVVVWRRGDQPWAGSYRLYLWLGVWIVLIRLVFRVIFGSGPGTVLIELPTIPLPEWVAGLQLLGPVTREGVVGALSDGLRLAAIVISVGAANALANPKRTLKSLPASLHEFGTVLVIAVSTVPQLGESVQRVRAAQLLRPAPGGRGTALRRLVVPVLEDALDRSMILARSMDARGYGRADTHPSVVARLLMATGLVGLMAGSYGTLDPTAAWWLGWPMLVLGAVAALAGVRRSGAGVARTRYRPDPWRGPEWAVTLGGVAVAGSAAWLAVRDPMVAGTPQVSTVSLLLSGLVLVAALPSPGAGVRVAAPA